MATAAARITELSWLDGRDTITVTELSRVCSLSADELHELVAYGAIAPLADAVDETRFSAEWVPPLRTAGRLRRDFDLDLIAVALLMDALRRIDTLEGALRALGAQLPAPAPSRPPAA